MKLNKNIFKQNQYWFRPKSYGYGFTPISWEGWVSTGIFIGFLLLSSYSNNINNINATKQDGLRFLTDVILSSFIFYILSKDKTKGKLKWYWGRYHE